MNRKDERAEEWLDSALAKLRESAPAVEPEAGFETRLIRRLHQEAQPARRSRWQIWFAAAGLAAAFGVLVWIATPPTPGPPPVTAWAPPTVSLPGRTPARATARVRKAFAPRRHPVYSAVFPTPTPLTEQERLLLRYVATASPEELRHMAKSAVTDDDAFPFSFGSSR